MSPSAISPVAKKLLIKPGQRVLVLRPEPMIDDAIAVLPPGATRIAKGPGDVVLLFARDSKALAKEMPRAFAEMAEGASLWIAYPKISSKVDTDLTRDRGWEAVTREGWQVVSLVALDATWSALRFKRDEGGALAASRAARALARKDDGKRTSKKGATPAKRSAATVAKRIGAKKRPA